MLDKEPAIIIGTIGAAIVAVIEVVAPEFFPDLGDPLITLVQALVTIITIFAVRMKVWSPASHVDALGAADTTRSEV